MANKYKNNNVSKVLLIVLSVLLIGGTATIAYASEGFQNWDTSTWFKPEEKPTEEKSPIQLKMLKEEVLEDGTIRKIVNYTLTPEDSTIKEVEATAKYEDGSSCAEVISVSVNKDLQQVTLDFKADFDKKIIVTLTSKSNPEVTATITCDYEKRLKEYSLKPLQDENNVITYGYVDPYLKVINPTDFLNLTYSKYTIDSNYSFDLAISGVDLNETLSSSNIQKAKSIYTGSASLFTQGGFSDFLRSYLDNSHLPTAEELFNLENGSTFLPGDEGDTAEWKQLLLAQDKDNYDPWYFDVSGGIRIMHGSSQVALIPFTKAYVGFSFANLDFSKYEVKATNITPEVNNLVI